MVTQLLLHFCKTRWVTEQKQRKGMGGREAAQLVRKHLETNQRSSKSLVGENTRDSKRELISWELKQERQEKPLRHG